MSFEEFHLKNPQYSYLVAKIHYNIMLEKKSPDLTLHISLTPTTDSVCESCSA